MLIKPRLKAAGWALLATAIFAGWQQTTVSRNFDGNWTALFCTGYRQPVPPELQAGTYRVANPIGYDGQMYRYVAHDPFLTGNAHKYLDNPSLRVRRILIPMLAWCLAFGQQRWIDTAYILLFFVTCFSGTYWLALYLADCGMDYRWSLLFLAFPATLIAIDRLVIDMASAALAVGIVRYAKSGGRRMLLATLLLNCLCRETGFIFAAAFAAGELMELKWRQATGVAAITLPALLWYAFVYSRLGRVAFPEWFGKTNSIGPVRWLLHPMEYSFSPLATYMAQSLDRLAIVGMLLGFALAIVFAFKHLGEPLHLAALLFALSAATTLDPYFWDGVQTFARPYSPMLVVIAMQGIAMQRYRLLRLLPIALMDPRIIFEFTPQIAGVFGIHVAS